MKNLQKYMAMQAARGGAVPEMGEMGETPAQGAMLHSEDQEDEDYVKTHPVASGAAIGPEGAEMQLAGDEQDENAAIKALMMRLGLG